MNHKRGVNVQLRKNVILNTQILFCNYMSYPNKMHAPQKTQPS